jgi:hypothetical protein
MAGRWGLRVPRLSALLWIWGLFSGWFRCGLCFFFLEEWPFVARYGESLVINCVCCDFALAICGLSSSQLSKRRVHGVQMSGFLGG